MQNWLMLTLVGEDQPGIVAKITRVLFENECNLGEASMMRLGGNFTIMLMVQTLRETSTVEEMLIPHAQALGLHLHVDEIQGYLHQQHQADVHITVYGADRAGIVADVTGTLAEAGLNIIGLDSDVGGSDAAPIYIMQIDGEAKQGVDALQEAMNKLIASLSKPLEVRITPIFSNIM